MRTGKPGDLGESFCEQRWRCSFCFRPTATTNGAISLLPEVILPLGSGLPYVPRRPGQTTVVEKFLMGEISEFICRHYRHFNAAALSDAAEAYVQPPQ